MKLCTKCRTEKPLDDFPKDRSRKDGLNNKCRPCCLKQWQDWRSKNLERSQRYHREYRSKTLEERAERADARTFATPEDRSRYAHEWYLRNAGAVQERARAWKWANPEKDAAVSKNWRKKFPDRHCQRSARYRALKRSNTVEHVDYAAIIERDNRTCHICGAAVDLSLPKYHPMSKSFDHVIPLARGGPHSMSNVKLAHFGCNSRKGAR